MLFFHLSSVSSVSLWNVTAASVDVQANGAVSIQNLILPDLPAAAASSVPLNVLSRTAGVRISVPNGFRSLDGVISVSFVSGATVSTPSNCTVTSPSALVKSALCGASQSSTASSSSSLFPSYLLLLVT